MLAMLVMMAMLAMLAMGLVRPTGAQGIRRPGGTMLGLLTGVTVSTNLVLSRTSTGPCGPVRSVLLPCPCGVAQLPGASPPRYSVLEVHIILVLSRTSAVKCLPSYL